MKRGEGGVREKVSDVRMCVKYGMTLGKRFKIYAARV